MIDNNNQDNLITLLGQALPELDDTAFRQKLLRQTGRLLLQRKIIRATTWLCAVIACLAAVPWQSLQQTLDTVWTTLSLAWSVNTDLMDALTQQWQHTPLWLQELQVQQLSITAVMAIIAGSVVMTLLSEE